MKSNHYETEQSFYKALFTGTGKYGKSPWGTDPSESMVVLMKKHNLINGFGKKALDIGCGQGRHIALLRQCGYEVIGVDFSQDALDICKKRFADDKLVTLKKVDLTKPNCLKDLGKFDLVLQWSVLDHIRAKYVKTFLRNVVSVIENFFIVCEFSTFENKFKNKSYKIENGHYSRCYTSQELTNVFSSLQKIDLIESGDEVRFYNIKFHTILFQKNKE